MHAPGLLAGLWRRGGGQVEIQLMTHLVLLVLLTSAGNSGSSAQGSVWHCYAPWYEPMPSLATWRKH